MWRCELSWKYFGNGSASKEIKGLFGSKHCNSKTRHLKNSLSLQKHFETFVFRLYLRLLFFRSPTFLSLTQQFNLNHSFSAMSFQNPSRADCLPSEQTFCFAELLKLGTSLILQMFRPPLSVLSV